MKDIIGGIVLIFFIPIAYALGAWLDMWNFSSIVMSTLTILNMLLIILIYVWESLHNQIDYSSDIDRVLWENQSINTKLEVLEKTILTNNKQLKTTLEKIDELKEQLETTVEPVLENIETTLEKIDELKEQLENIIEHIDQNTDKVVEYMDEIKKQIEPVIVNIENHTEILETTLEKISESKEQIITTDTNDEKIDGVEFVLENINELKEQLEIINTRNDELYEMYEPLMIYVSNLTDDMEYGKLLSEQIRTFMKRSAEQIETNEKLAEEVEIMLAYQRNQRK